MPGANLGKTRQNALQNESKNSEQKPSKNPAKTK
jgi:hypothetical protein